MELSLNKKLEPDYLNQYDLMLIHDDAIEQYRLKARPPTLQEKAFLMLCYLNALTQHIHRKGDELCITKKQD